MSPPDVVQSAGDLFAIVTALGAIGVVCVALANLIDRLDKTRAMREAALREAEEARAKREVRARMHGRVFRAAGGAR